MRARVSPAFAVLNVHRGQRFERTDLRTILCKGPLERRACADLVSLLEIQPSHLGLHGGGVRVRTTKRGQRLLRGGRISGGQLRARKHELSVRISRGDSERGLRKLNGLIRLADRQVEPGQFDVGGHELRVEPERLLVQQQSRRSSPRGSPGSVPGGNARLPRCDRRRVPR